MQLKSFLLGLGILGSSTVALADHNTSSWQQQRRTTVVHRQPVRQPVYQPATYQQYRSYEPAYRQHTTWQALTSRERLERGGDVFDLSSRERFSQLRLQNQTGRTLVRQIDIVFADGQRQCVQVNQLLDGNHAMINVDLDGDARRIDKIFIDGRSGLNGSYQLYAM